MVETGSFSGQIADIKSVQTLLLGSDTFTERIYLDLSFTQLETVGKFTLVNLITKKQHCTVNTVTVI